MEIEDFLNIFCWFKNYPSRREDYQNIEQTMDLALKELKQFVSSRLLLIGSRQSEEFLSTFLSCPIQVLSSDIDW